jgi:hypothetical protein
MLNTTTQSFTGTDGNTYHNGKHRTADLHGSSTNGFSHGVATWNYPGSTVPASSMSEKGWWGNGSYRKGTTGWHFEGYPCDEFGEYWGGTFEGAIQGRIQGVAKRPGGHNNFFYEKNHANHLYGETYPYFLGSVSLPGAGATGKDGKSLDAYGVNRAAIKTFSDSNNVRGAWIHDEGSDGKLNKPSERFAMNLPVDQGILWIRMRTDYHTDGAGFWWKAVNLNEWFCFDPSLINTYPKDGSGAIVIYVNPHSTPYMSYGK